MLVPPLSHSLHESIPVQPDRAASVVVDVQFFCLILDLFPKKTIHVSNFKGNDNHHKSGLKTAHTRSDFTQNVSQT